MKLHSFIDASFVSVNDSKVDNSFSLEIGKIYKARVVSLNGNTLYFSINNQIFKSSFINTSSKYLLLKVLENNDIYKFELIRENVFHENIEDLNKNLISLLREKYSDSFIDKLIEEGFLNLKSNDNNDILEFIKNINISKIKLFDSKYHLLLKINDDRFFHIVFNQTEPHFWSFSLHFELDGKKILLIKGYYQKKIGKINCNFITDSLSFYKKTINAENELNDINPKYKWLCSRRFESEISI